jgi:hypothetical protein
MAAVIASLSENGWVTDSAKKLNAAISYYILTDAAQTLIFKDNLISLPLTYYKFINDPDEMTAAVKNDLDKLLGRYFSIVDVNTETKQLSDSKYGILLYASVITDDGSRLDLSKVVEITTTGLRKIIDVNNFGDGLALLQTLS